MKSVLLKGYKVFTGDIGNITVNGEKKIINTINAHSYIVAKKEKEFRRALVESDILLPDGEGIVLMIKKLTKKKIIKVAGADIHLRLLQLSEKEGLKCFYLGSSEATLRLINDKLSPKYKNVSFGFYSPPFKDVFSEFDTQEMIRTVNEFQPDILFLGMTAPKQEQWSYNNKNELNTKIICSIGAVFDFIAETKKRAPKWVIKLRLEWLYRSFTAWRLTKRYLYSTPLFLLELYTLKYFNRKRK